MDADALETSRAILAAGGLLSLFPEGTRVREPDELGEPRRGATRLAIEAGAPLVPAAITGTDHLWLGPIPKPKKVAVAFGDADRRGGAGGHARGGRGAAGGRAVAEVETQFRGLLSRPGAIAAGLATLGLGGAAVVARQRRGRPKGPLARRGAGLGRGRRRPGRLPARLGRRKRGRFRR